MRKTTERQYELLKQVCIYRQEHGYSPSFRELANLTQISDVKSIYRIITKLEKAGFIEKEKNKARSIKLTKKGMEVIGLLSFPITFIPPASSLDQLFKPPEFLRNGVTISSHSQEFIGYGNKSFETNGTYSRDYLREIIKSEISAMGDYPTGTNVQGHDPKEVVIKSFTSAILYQLSHEKKYITIFGWAIVSIFLTWGSVSIIGNNPTALVYSVTLCLLIKKFLK